MTGSTFLEITLQDVNDNAPVISGSYNIFINEEQENISVQIQAFDNDEPGTNNSRLRFQLEPGAFSANFTIDPATGVLRSLGALDREALEPALKGKVVVTVRVHDLGVPQLSSLVNVTITVEDVNDNAPVFLNESYAFSVREGAFVGSVEAEDADQTEVHHRISFQLVSSTGSSNFLLRSIRLGPGHYQGNLSLDPDVALDYDRLSPARFTLTVQAENTGTGDALNAVPCTVQVQVLDVNDEPPTLVPASPQDVSVAEDAKPGLLTTLQASDLDTNHSLHFQELGLACYKGAGTAGRVCQDWFYLEPNGSVFLNSSQLDYEACDRVTIALRVEDTHTEEGNPYSNNGGAGPTTSSPAAPHVTLVSPVDLPVAVVKARDADSGPRGAITFSISKVLFLQDNGPSHTLTSVFKVATAAEGDLYVGSIQAQEKSVMEAYFVYSNGTALGVNELSIGLSVWGGAVCGVCASLSPFPAPASIALCSTPRHSPLPTVCFCSYRRKLKAMKALKVASTLTANVAQQGPTIPGTNKYNAEGPAGGRSDQTGTAQPDNTLANLCCSLSHSLNSLDENIVENLAEGSPGAPELQVGEQPPCPPLRWWAWPAWPRALPVGRPLWPCTSSASPTLCASLWAMAVAAPWLWCPCRVLAWQRHRPSLRVRLAHLGVEAEGEVGMGAQDWGRPAPWGGN
uniref:Cadherin domain-containing protein n=1 Tax=Chrysemys picta bellii TaxID=8478 RepID=A0A8C3IED1_CHRPI